MPPEPMSLYATGHLLGSIFLGGIVGNVAAAFLWDGGKCVCKPVLDKIPDLAALFAKGGSNNNHDLLRALRRAECRAVVSLCEQALLNDFQVRTGKRPLVERIHEKWRAWKEPDIKVLFRIRQVFTQTYNALQSVSVEELVRMHGGAVSDVPALIQAGRECFAAENPDQLREIVVGRQVAALDRVVRGVPGSAGLNRPWR